jgi:hypothetical protein
VIGEAELVDGVEEKDTVVHGVSAVTLETVELVVIDRYPYECMFRADGNMGILIERLSSLRQLAGASTTAIHRLAAVSKIRHFSCGQLCLAYPPERMLGAASCSADMVCCLIAGEAKVLCNPSATETHEASPSLVLEGVDSGGPLIDEAPPRNSLVEYHVGTPLVAVAKLLSAGCEVIDGNLFNDTHTRWCLQPTSQTIELLLVPRAAWLKIVRPALLEELCQLAATRASFLEKRVVTSMRTRLQLCGSSAQASYHLPTQRFTKPTTAPFGTHLVPGSVLAPMVRLPPKLADRSNLALCAHDAKTVLTEAVPTSPRSLRMRPNMHDGDAPLRPSSAPLRPAPTRRARHLRPTSARGRVPVQHVFDAGGRKTGGAAASRPSSARSQYTNAVGQDIVPVPLHTSLPCPDSPVSSWVTWLGHAKR